MKLRSRLALLLLLICSASPALAQSVTVGSDDQGPTTWVTENDRVLFGRAGIRLPQAFGDFRLVKVRMYDKEGFDGSASYERGDDRLTLFIYQPIDSAISLQWAVADASMRSRFQESGRTAETGTAELPRGMVALTSHAAAADAAPLTDVLAMGRTGKGWNVKLRLTAAMPRAAAVDLVRAFYGSIGLPDGERLSAPSTAAIPDCTPLALSKSPRIRRSLGETDRMALTLVAAAQLAEPGKMAEKRNWCRAGKAMMGEQELSLFRDAETGVFRAPFGDNGVMLALEPTLFSTRPDDWILTLKRISDQFIIELWSGPGDDEDFAAAVRRFPEASRSVITAVDRK